jgi:hypothetical protein
MSFLSLLIYLNTNVAGGETTFFLPHGERAKVFPKEARALLFWHGRHPGNAKHGGSPVHGGVKYVLRSDIMFSNLDPGMRCE